MFDTIMGLPVHALVVHATVAAVPLAGALAILAAVWPPARRRFGWLIVAVVAGATVLVPITTESGEKLEHRIGGGGALVEEHAELGDSLLYWVLPLLIVTAALILLAKYPLGSRTPAPTGTTVGSPSSGADTTAGTATATATRSQVAAPAQPAWQRIAVIIAAVLTVALGVGSVVQVIRIGHSGAKAVWSDVAKTEPQGGDDD